MPDRQSLSISIINKGKESLLALLFALPAFGIILSLVTNGLVSLLGMSPADAFRAFTTIYFCSPLLLTMILGLRIPWQTKRIPIIKPDWDWPKHSFGIAATLAFITFSTISIVVDNNFWWLVVLVAATLNCMIVIGLRAKNKARTSISRTPPSVLVKGTIVTALTNRNTAARSNGSRAVSIGLLIMALAIFAMQIPWALSSCMPIKHIRKNYNWRIAMHGAGLFRNSFHHILDKQGDGEVEQRLQVYRSDSQLQTGLLNQAFTLSHSTTTAQPQSVDGTNRRIAGETTTYEVRQQWADTLSFYAAALQKLDNLYAIPDTIRYNAVWDTTISESNDPRFAKSRTLESLQQWLLRNIGSPDSATRQHLISVLPNIRRIARSVKDVETQRALLPILQQTQWYGVTILMVTLLALLLFRWLLTRPNAVESPTNEQSILITLTNHGNPAPQISGANQIPPVDREVDRAIVDGFIVVILCLLIPLVRPIKESDIRVDKPYALLGIANWFLPAYLKATVDDITTINNGSLTINEMKSDADLIRHMRDSIIHLIDNTTTKMDSASHVRDSTTRSTIGAKVDALSDSARLRDSLQRYKLDSAAQANEEHSESIYDASTRYWNQQFSSNKMPAWKNRPKQP